jgi:DNA modification methylase
MMTDILTGAGSDKRYHAWGQDAGEAVYLVERLTKPGDLVVDPFVGGGSILVACKGTARRWLGTESDPQTAAVARARLRDLTQDTRR